MKASRHEDQSDRAERQHPKTAEKRENLSKAIDQKSMGASWSEILLQPFGVQKSGATHRFRSFFTA
jgi:hypothetical protein